MAKRRNVNRITTDSMTPREKIMEVAEDLIARHGPEDFQLQEIAKILGVKPPALYNHFESRDDLVAEIAARGTRELTALMVPIPGEETLERYVRLARVFAEFLISNRWYARMTLWEIAKSGATNWVESTLIDTEFRVRQKKSFERHVRDGEISEMRIEGYLPYLMAGVAAACLWSEYDPTARSASKKQLLSEVENLARRILQPTSHMP